MKSPCRIKPSASSALYARPSLASLIFGVAPPGPNFHRNGLWRNLIFVEGWLGVIVTVATILQVGGAK